MPPSRRPGRPLVFAHRGSSAAEPEHTLTAYLRAIEEGADGVECDVRLTRDGQLVCVHDRRLERTSNGHGLVSTRTLAELGELDFGSWHPGPGEEDGAPMYDVSVDGRARILTLDRLLGAVHDANRPMRLLIETKHPTRYGAAVEEMLVESLRRHGLHEPRAGHPVEVTVMSFSALAVRRTRRLAPLLPTVMLLDLLPAGLRGGRLPFGSRIGGPGVRLLRAHPEVAQRLHARGHQVYVWTVNEAADVDLMVELGVEGLITDRPAFVRRRLDELGLPRS
ncbi:glycerophosphodiester phosphodiesterase [Planosporangium flavigriseum]|nr:glycerophosphodiester phosphodiesterase family protein [Planosporangium flavigriseum]NJC64586.1 glycerophosphodiester phosphodiesterase [Planosporangium flavigriseum]